MRMTSARSAFVIGVASVALVAGLLDRDIVSAQNQNNLVAGPGQSAPTPAPAGRGRRAAPLAKPGAPEPIVGGVRPPVQVIVAAVMRPAGQDLPPPARVLRNPAMTPGVPAEATRRVPIPTPAPGRIPPHSAAPACSPPKTPPAG